MELYTKKDLILFSEKAPTIPVVIVSRPILLKRMKIINEKV